MAPPVRSHSRASSIHRTARLVGTGAVALALAVTTAVAPAYAASPAIPAAASAATLGALPAAAAADGAAPTPTGQACLPGQGVTVVVDFTQAKDAYGDQLPGPIEIGCAIGQQDTIADAGQAAGFAFDTSGGFLQSINEVAPDTPGDPSASAYWGIYTSTSNHLPDGPAASSWQYSNVGIDGGPATVGTAVLFQIEQYPATDPRPFGLALADLSGYQPNDDAAPLPGYPTSVDGSAVAAAIWLGNQVRAGGNLLTSSGATDYGLTIDGVIALAAAGTGKDVIAAAAQNLFQSGTAYIGTADQSADKWAAIAKMALALNIAGLDPTAFPAADGTRNLINELRLAQNADGSFGAAGTDLPFTHAFALFALERTDGGVPPTAVTWLQQQQCTTSGAAMGSYGYGGCDSADLDSTALAVQALLGAGVAASDPSVAAADAWMQSLQGDDGSLPGYAGPNTNSTGLGAQALLASGETYHRAATAAAGYIGSLQVSCRTLDGNALTTGDLGAIAYGRDDWTSAVATGIGKADHDVWIRSTTQALLGLGLPAIPQITAAGATDLPEPQPCAAASTTNSPTATGQTSSHTSPVGSTDSAVPGPATSGNASPSSSGDELAATGVNRATPWLVTGGLLALLLGAALMRASRERRTRRGWHAG